MIVDCGAGGAKVIGDHARTLSKAFALCGSRLIRIEGLTAVRLKPLMSRHLVLSSTFEVAVIALHHIPFSMLAGLVTFQVTVALADHITLRIIASKSPLKRSLTGLISIDVLLWITSYRNTAVCRWLRSWKAVQGGSMNSRMRLYKLSFGQGRIVGLDGLCEFHVPIIDVLSSGHTGPSVGRFIRLDRVACSYLLVRTVLIISSKDLPSKPLW